MNLIKYVFGLQEDDYDKHYDLRLLLNDIADKYPTIREKLFEIFY
jgi:hypothetical protein